MELLERSKQNSRTRKKNLLSVGGFPGLLGTKPLQTLKLGDKTLRPICPSLLAPNKFKLSSAPIGFSSVEPSISDWTYLSFVFIFGCVLHLIELHPLRTQIVRRIWSEIKTIHFKITLRFFNNKSISTNICINK